MRIRKSDVSIAKNWQVITLLALDDQGAPGYDHHHAPLFASMEIPCFACTPDQFPDLMAMAIKKQDVAAWAAARG